MSQDSAMTIIPPKISLILRVLFHTIRNATEELARWLRGEGARCASLKS